MGEAIDRRRSGRGRLLPTGGEKTTGSVAKLCFASLCSRASSRLVAIATNLVSGPDNGGLIWCSLELLVVEDACF